PGFDSQYLGLPVTQTTIASYLQELGYVNGLIGKWHLGDAPQFHPLKRGFDEFWGYTGGGHDYFQSKVDGKGYLSPVECNYKTPEPLTYITDDVGNEAVGFIQRHQKERFFLFTSFNAPHTPLQALEEDINQYMHIGDEKRRTYAAMVHRLDINVGKIMTAIEEAGISEKTLIVFLSDNGGPTDTNASVNAPLNGQKGILLEGGIRVPFIMNWEGTIQKKTVYEKPVSSLDLAPTFFLLAGGKSKGKFPFDGVNLIPFLDKNNQEVPHQELYWRFTISAAIREGDWKLIRLPDRLPLLYNLSVDISEQDNVALDYPEKTAELLKKLGDWDVSLPHPVFLEGAEWKRRQLNLYDKEYLLDQPKK
ncbi:MAG: sulfatase-like hydrolase/transferase, partial [Bacteroidetes bacterium]|nr:sulfatase-like hydrolase/transferase [Bacteroidota bacterium]